MIADKYIVSSQLLHHKVRTFLEANVSSGALLLDMVESLSSQITSEKNPCVLALIGYYSAQSIVLRENLIYSVRKILILS